MTCFDKYITEHELPVRGCPHDYSYAERPKECYSMSCFAHCWAREIDKENDKEN